MTGSSQYGPSRHGTRERVGLLGALNSLGNRLEEARRTLEEVRQIHHAEPDVMSRISADDINEDLLIRLAHIRKEMSYHYEGAQRFDVNLVDLLWAADFMDHLDTLGLRIAPHRMTRRKREDDNAA